VILVVTVPTRLATGETATVIARVTDAWVTVLEPTAPADSAAWKVPWVPGPAAPGEPVPAAQGESVPTAARTWRPIRSDRFYGSLPLAEADE
jgi:hypothetical protein